MALRGESGSGKSTRLNLIAGLEPADTGEIRIGGRAVHGLDPDQAAQLRSTELGFVFQAFHLIGHLDLAQNVAVPLLLLGGPLGLSAAASLAVVLAFFVFDVLGTRLLAAWRTGRGG